MAQQVGARKKKTRRPLPPGQKLLLWMLVAGASAAVTVSVWQARPNAAQQLQEQPAAAPQAFGVPRQAVAAVPTAGQLPFPLTQPMTELANKVSLDANNPKLHAGVFAVDPDTGRYLDIDARRAYSAASMIKLPVLVAMLEAIDQGKIKYDQILTITQEIKGGGSGCLQWRPVGSKISLNDCAQLMMIISDNTATNMIIDLLGGQDVCNADFARFGLANTRINNPLPDLTGTNTTSPYDLALLLAKVDNGQLISSSSRSWLFHTMERSKIRTLLPMGIPRGAKIADKTGDIGSLVGDAGIITAPGGKRYIVVCAVERPWNDRRANALIRQISKDVYVGVTGDADGVKQLEAQQAAAPRGPVRRARHHRRRH